MNWRDTLIGSGITLIVTVFAGLFVYYFTKEPAIPPSAEHIVYSVQTSATFGVDPDKITFLTIRVENTGNKAAHNVRAVADLSQDYLIQSKQITLSSGSTTSITDNSSANKVDILVPDLVPSESFVISLLVKGHSGLSPNVNAKTNDSVGSIAPISLQTTTTTTRSEPVNSAVTVLAAGIGTLALYLIITIITIPQFHFEEFGLNNTAFVFIEQGLIAEARTLLSTVIATRGGKTFSFANYALVQGLEGNGEGARKHFEIVKWWARSSHERAVIAFNEATLLIHDKAPESEILNLLRRAFALSRNEIVRYCKLNVIINEAGQGIPEIQSLVEQEENKSRRWPWQRAPLT